MTVLWWRDVWRSPMAREYLKADVHGLYRLAVLVDRFWCQPEVAVAKQISTDEQRYGLTPLDRRRLEWIVERAEAGKRKPPGRAASTDDVRQVLSVLK